MTVLDGGGNKSSGTAPSSGYSQWAVFGTLLATAESLFFCWKYVPGIVRVYYSSWDGDAFLEENYRDYELHIAAFSVYVVGMMLAAHSLAFVFGRFVGITIGSLLRLLKIRGVFNLPFPHALFSKGFLKYTSIHSHDAIITLLVFAASAGVFTGLIVVELTMLEDMSIHVVDVDLMDALGLPGVLLRRRTLGFGLDPNHLPGYLLLVSILGSLGLAAFLLFGYVWSSVQPRIGRQHWSLLIFRVGLLALMCFLSTWMLGTVFMVHRHDEWVATLPFNLLWYRPKELVDTAIRPMRSADGEGLPYVSNLGTDPWSMKWLQKQVPSGLDLQVPRKRHIVLMLQESFRMDVFEEESPLLHDYISSRRCERSKRHLSSGHVSEMSLFSIIYGLHSFRYHQTNKEWLASFPMALLGANGYRRFAYGSSTALWPFPNANQYRNFEFYKLLKDNEELAETVAHDLDHEWNQQDPLLLLIFLHKSNKPNGWFGRDKSRDEILHWLEKRGITGPGSDSLLLMLGDHGDMNGEHGEEGHGQHMSTWWKEKTEVPFAFCDFDRAKEALKKPVQQARNATDRMNWPLTSHVDVFHTVLARLGVEEGLLGKVTEGGDLYNPTYAEDPSRLVFMFGRHFPERDRNLAVGDLWSKWWFRVRGARRNSSGKLLMDFQPLAVMEWDDTQLCSAQQLIASFFSKLDESHSSCRVENLHRYLDHFQNHIFERFMVAKV